MQDALLFVMENVKGRVLIEEEGGEEASLLDTMQLMDDLATHQDSVFDDRCDIFPLSIRPLLIVMNRADSSSKHGLAIAAIGEEINTAEQVCCYGI